MPWLTNSMDRFLKNLSNTRRYFFRLKTIRLSILKLFQALDSYKRAYDLDASNELVLKICSLMLELPMEPGRAKYWVEVCSQIILCSRVLNEFYFDRLLRRPYRTTTWCTS